MAHLLHDIELPLVEVLADMEHTGVRIDTDALATYSKALTQRLADIERACIDLAGIQFNVGSPAQVGEVLFDKLKIDEKAKKLKLGNTPPRRRCLRSCRENTPSWARSWSSER